MSKSKAPKMKNTNVHKLLRKIKGVSDVKSINGRAVSFWYNGEPGLIDDKRFSVFKDEERKNYLFSVRINSPDLDEQVIEKILTSNLNGRYEFINGGLEKEATASTELKLFAYRGQPITASSKVEAIQKIIADSEPITVDKIDKTNYKKYLGKYVNVKGNVYLPELGLKKLPIKFCKVDGDFDCSDNELTSLEGAPKRVGGNFDCTSNELTSLEGAPEKVGGFFNCSANKLTSLKGAPKEVRDFDCSLNYKKFTRLDVKKISKVRCAIDL